MRHVCGVPQHKVDQAVGRFASKDKDYSDFKDAAKARPQAYALAQAH